MEEVRFERGTARISRWCAVEHREIDWASRSSHEESAVVIMIAVLTEEMHGSDRNSDLN